MEPQDILSMGASSQNISTQDKANIDTSLVKVLISYPEGYAKRRFHENGKVYEVSAETANTMIEKGIASMVDEDDKEVAEEAASSPEENTGQLDNIISEKDISTIVDDATKESISSSAETANTMIEKAIDEKVISTAPVAAPDKEKKAADQKSNPNKKSTPKK